MTTAFVNGLVILGNGRFLEGATVLVEGEKIVRVAAGNVALPAGAREISLAGRALLPGFIDCHVHLILDGSPDPLPSCLSGSSPANTLKAAHFARETLMCGVTTIRDMGSRDGIDFSLRAAVASGLIPGPRMLVSGEMICMTGGHGWQFGREADGPDQVGKAVREQIKAGADIVKFIATGGVMTPGVEPGCEQLSEGELRAGIREAHKAGRKTGAHALGARGIMNALRAGIDSIEHGAFLDEEAAALMVRRGVHLVPTLSALHHIETRGAAAGIPAFAVEKSLKLKPFLQNSIRVAREAGVLVAMGTDAGTPYNLHGKNLEELKRLTERGFSPMEAIEAGTGIAARALGLEKELGAIEEGKLADLVMVEGNPLEEIDRLLDPDAIRVIMKGGVFAKG
ncbi:MAG: amidohydrolase family protein [Desulfobacterales bacterium]|nr:amidohydrolase family protein [Desulfobacterales bacterium]